MGKKKISFLTDKEIPRKKEKYEKDYTTIALAHCIIKSWKDYKFFEKALVKRMQERGFKEDDSWDAESFISDRIIGDELDDALEFEKDLRGHLKGVKK